MKLLPLLHFGLLIVATWAAYTVIARAYPGPADSKPELVKKLFHQMSRWSTAASQDENPIVKVLHANYGVAYMMALQDITNNGELTSILGLANIDKLFAEVSRVQSEATTALVKQCPTVAPASMLAKHGGEA